MTRPFVYSMRLLSLSALCATASAAETFKYTTEIPEGIVTPDKVETSIGRLDFTDGVPSRETADKVYDFMDTARAADAFLKGMPAASLDAMLKGNQSLGAVEPHQVVLFDGLMDAKSLFLTANTSTIYVFPDLDLKRNGPTVVESPVGLLGAANDGFFALSPILPAASISFCRPAMRGRFLRATRFSDPKPIACGSSCAAHQRANRPRMWRLQPMPSVTD